MPMNNNILLFSAEEGNLFIRLLLAHIISDFALQSNKMVESKKWFSKFMLFHIALIFASTLILSGFLWRISIAISLLHWLVDSVKIEIQSRKTIKQNLLFVADQTLHFLIVVTMWFWHFNLFDKLLALVSLPFVNYKFSIIILAYAWVYFPVGYFIKFATQSINHNNTTNTETSNNNIEHGGKLIGQFERIIILTLVLLNQYEAIGFLITGKSIIRFADHNSDLRSEYVLVGTMMSYALAILSGVFVNYLLSF